MFNNQGSSINVVRQRQREEWEERSFVKAYWLFFCPLYCGVFFFCLGKDRDVSLLPEEHKHQSLMWRQTLSINTEHKSLQKWQDSAVISAPSELLVSRADAFSLMIQGRKTVSFIPGSTGNSKMSQHLLYQRNLLFSWIFLCGSVLAFCLRWAHVEGYSFRESGGWSVWQRLEFTLNFTFHYFRSTNLCWFYWNVCSKTISSELWRRGRTIDILNI